jgi:hypothetical protein
MKKILISAGILFISAICPAQTGSREEKPHEELKREQYTVAGYRHGVSYFPKLRFPGVRYESTDSLHFNEYHSLDVIYSWLDKWAEEFPDLVDLYEVGSSFEGRPILQITLTNKNSGKDVEKPAAFFEGGRHSGEITSSECVMWMIKYLLNNYGSDPDVTHLLDTKAIYLRPVNNPDGHNLYLNTCQSNRSTVRPDDNDYDLLMDEDAPEDLDNDGMILTMRWKDDKKGNMIPDPRDSTGRIMKRVPEGEGIYLTSSEGIDNDGDGRINEDGIGGLDLHRNYPENWRPQQESTGRGFTQRGAGEFPLSETETRSVVSFLLSHPNIYVVNSMDTSVPMHLRPPSTSESDDRMYQEDLAWYKTFDQIGRKITGYEKAGDVYKDYGDGNPLFGHGPDFGYWYFGAIWYGDELWNGAKYKDYNNDGEIDQLDILKWDDQENEGSGFIEWKPLKHPVYGDIEVGGFELKFFSQNPPPWNLEPWVRNEGMFNIEMVKYLPELKWDEINIKRVKTYKTDSTDFDLTIGVRNSGHLPTALKQAHLVKIVREDRIELEIDTTGQSGEKPFFRVIDEKKSASGGGDRMTRVNDRGSQLSGKISRNVSYIQGGSVVETTFRIRVYNSRELEGTANFYSTRGGVLKDKEFVIK